MLIVLAVMTWVGIKMIRLAGDDLIDSYPYLWPDSFDWLANGLYYYETFLLHKVSQVPTIRQPFFTFLVTFSIFLSDLRIPLILSVLAQVGALLLMIPLGKKLGMSSFFIMLAVCATLFHYSAALFRLYYMADHLCLFLLLAATLLYMKSFDGRTCRVRLLIGGATISAVASMTQFYGIFPSICFSTLLMGYAIRQKSWNLMLFSLLNGGISLFGEIMWRGFKLYHFGSFSMTQVSHFELLRLSFQNALFYKHVWAVFFMPLLISVLILSAQLRVPKGWFSSFSHQLIFLIVLLFMVFLFVYQWQESRFTSFFLPLVFLLGFSLLDYSSRSSLPIAVRGLLVFAVGYTAMTPTDNLMGPNFSMYMKNLGSPSVVWGDNYLAQLSRAKPLARFAEMPCLGRARDGSFVPSVDCDAYVYRNLARYRNFRRSIGKDN